MQVQVIPAVLVKTRDDLWRRLAVCRAIGATTAHIDVMDNRFVPNATCWPITPADLDPKLSYNFHWMVRDPERYILLLPGPHLHLVHIEAAPDPARVFAAIRQAGGQTGLVLNPETPVSAIAPYISAVTRVLVMSVHPGFDKQKYLPEVEDKVKWLRQFHPQLEIEVDGGINPQTAYLAAKAGADKLAAASAIFNAPDPKQAFQEIQSAGQKAWDEKENEPSPGKKAGAGKSSGAKSKSKRK